MLGWERMKKNLCLVRDIVFLSPFLVSPLASYNVTVWRRGEVPPGGTCSGALPPLPSGRGVLWVVGRRESLAQGLFYSCGTLDCFPYSVAHAKHHAQRQ